MVVCSVSININTNTYTNISVGFTVAVSNLRKSISSE